MNITIYTMPNCPLCEQAKALCKAKGLAYEEVPFASERGVLMLELFPMVRQAPAVFIGNERVGGFEGLKQALKQVGV